jgi:hypothetical protein
MTLRERLSSFLKRFPASYVASSWLRTAAAFVATLAVFGLIYGASVAWRERLMIPLDPPAPALPEAGSQAIVAAAQMLSLGNIDPAREAWFTPPARTRRAAAFQAGAADAVAAFTEVADRSRRGRDPDFDLALAALSDPNTDVQTRHAIARDALRRVNARGDRRAPMDQSARTLAALARAAAAQMRVHERALAEVALDDDPGHLSRAAEEAFYRARGNAYAWRAMLGAFSADMKEEQRQDLLLAIETARTALAQVADFEPAVLVNPLFGGERPLPKLTRRLAAVDMPLEALNAAASGEGH